MSKLSFRARALDSNKSLPVYHAKDIPDLAEFSSVNRVVPQMPTGMEKEEETEHHLQRAITAQQIYGEANRRIIPTPEAVFIDASVNRVRKKEYPLPKQLIHVQAFNLEDELPDYDLDSEDEAFLEHFNKGRSKVLVALDLEKMIDKLEKGCGSYAELLSFNEAKLLLKHEDADLMERVHEYWCKKKKNTETPLLTPQVKTEKKDGSTAHDPYVAFRRRVEKMQTRKNRKNDEASYERMLKLRRDLHRACKILELVKQREKMKKSILKSVVNVFEHRYKKEDFTGELLKQCYHILRDRQAYMDRQVAERRQIEDRLQGRHPDEALRPGETSEELRKRVRAQKRLPGQLGELPFEPDSIQSPELPTEPEDDPLGLDGKFTFKRKRGVLYRAPRYDSVGNWPWVHPVEGGSGDVRYRYCCTSIRKPRRCIGFARRRTGRGGRVIFDRAWTPFDDCSSLNSKKEPSKSTPPNGMIPATQDLRVPPWPHFKPFSDFLDDNDSSPNTPVKKFINARFRNDPSDTSILQSSPKLYRSFSTQPTSKFRVNPYPTNGVCINSQTFLSSLTSSLTKVPEPHSRKLGSNSDATSAAWPNNQVGAVSLSQNQSIQRTQNISNGQAVSSSQKLSSGDQYTNLHSNNSPASFHGQTQTNGHVTGYSNNTGHSMSYIHSNTPANNRLPPTGPSSAVFQLNFPLLKTKSQNTPPKGHLSRRLANSGENGKDHRNSHKRSSQINSIVSTVSSTQYRQPVSTLSGTNSAINIARAQETLPAFNTFRRPSTELPSAAPAAEVK